jgi:alpha-L-fucosidase 2
MLSDISTAMDMKKIRYCVMVILFLTCNQRGFTQLPKDEPVAESIDWSFLLSKYDLVWTKMPMNYYEGPYVGNGLLWAVFFKDTLLHNTICFEIGRADIYDHRTPEQIKDKYPWPKVRLPVGKLLLSTAGNMESVNFRTGLWDAIVKGA